jgi:hypothetical protein
MGRAASSKQAAGDGGATQGSGGGISPVLVIAVIVAIVGIGLFAFSGGSSSTSSSASAQPAAAAKADAPKTAESIGQPPTPEIVAATEKTAQIGAHRQTNLPPIPFAAYAPPRPPEVVTAAFHFAAEHPEITSYVPCFCGCQQGGHKGNHDCFVKSRDARGDVTEWEPHGVECAVCIDVATRSRQLLNSGASAADIRAAIEKEFVPSAMTMTPTPKPPAEGAHNH